ncbi:MAG: M48 family metalloprotease [Planctomycetota bacterium]|nr:M48 family metalloprotease [Planctomycetota bacterium]
MHLYLFLLVIVSLSCGSLPSQDGTIVEPALATACMTLAWIVLCHVSARICAVQVLREHIDSLAAAKLMERQLNIFRWLGLGIVVLCLAGFGLARNLDNISILRGSSFLQAVILLMPGLSITLGTWSAEHWYGVKVGYTNSKFKNFYRSLWQIFRGNVAWLIVPVLILLGMSDLISLMPVDEATSGMITVIMILLFVPLGLPWLVRHLFKTERLDRRTEHWVCELMNAVGLRRTRAVRWNTASQSFNALVAGFVPPIRTLLMSDRLLDELPQEQVAMVVLHEAAHLRRKHVPLRMLSVLPAWGAGALLTQLAGDQSWAMAAGSGIGIIMTLVVLRLVAYRTEYDADVQACRMAEQIATQLPGVPTTYDQAADALSAALMRVTFDQPESRRATWLHPGVADRVDFMRRERTTASENNATAGTMANPA